MTKSELITRLADRLNQRGTPLSTRDCEFAVKTLLDAMAEALAAAELAGRYELDAAIGLPPAAPEIRP